MTSCQWTLCGNNEAGVINGSVLSGLIDQQNSSDPSGKRRQQNDIKFDEIQEIRIEFLRILQIDYLWPLKNLVKLSLSHNAIEKISGLDDLVQLQELDLSFNFISVLENLDHLVKIEILILTGNLISMIDNINHLEKLTIFTVADNKIETWDHVSYLRRFKNLRSVNVSGNPCVLHDKYYNYFVAFIPQVRYFCYVMIKDDDRAKAAEEYWAAITKIEENEMRAQDELEEKQRMEEKSAINTKSFVNQLEGNELFSILVEQDKDGAALKNIDTDALAAFEEYSQSFASICHDLHEFGIDQWSQRENEITMYSSVVQTAQDEVRDASRQIIDSILEQRNVIFEKFDKEMDANETKTSNTVLRPSQLSDNHIDTTLSTIHDFQDEFERFLSAKWTKLVHSEVILHEQTEEINEVLKLNMTDMCNYLVEYAKTAFASMRNAAVQYHDSISRISKLHINNDEKACFISGRILDADSLNNMSASSHDMHLQVIDRHEDDMSQRILSWVDDLIDKLRKKERTRHRQRILEISHFLQDQREKMHNHMLTNDPLAQDVAAALGD